MPLGSWAPPRQAGHTWPRHHDKRKQLLGRRTSARPVCQSTRPAPLDCSRCLAAARAAESRQAAPLLADPYAASLAAQEGQDPVCSSLAWDVFVARFLDEQLLKAVSIVNLDLNQEYNQVVLVGDPMDTRPFRLPWPEGTVMYLVGEAAVHKLAQRVLREAGAHVPRGCLLVRVDADISGGASFAVALQREGFRGDRLSVWALQGASSCDVPAILADASSLAGYGSLVLGELPAMAGRDAANLVAAYGLLGGVVELEGQPGWDRLQSIWRQQEGAGEGPSLFISQQKRMSLQQMGIYNEHVAAAEETDEDFLGNFS